MTKLIWTIAGYVIGIAWSLLIIWLNHKTEIRQYLRNNKFDH
jgi:hypothetical protein